MFDALIAELVQHCTKVTRRAEGVAFFRAARDLYRLERLMYFCVDIPATSRHGVYSHCAYSDSEVFHCISYQPLGDDTIVRLASGNPAARAEAQAPGPAACQRAVVIPLRKYADETAALEVQVGREDFREDAQQANLQREMRILANYFHSHVLRMNGYDAAMGMLMSARELDCLKWAAAGKTAWEASVILGISERTVRFHLNSAREKLNCTTTTQAVAKAIANQLIDV